jgi:hypothetical protein
MTDISNIAPIELSADDPERQPCEIWTRVMGYHRPVSSFNIGKQGEFHERRWFREDAACTATAAAA